jgi:hypothetical protein
VVTIKNSVFANNEADMAGAICNNGSLTIHRSTVDGNEALAGTGVVSSSGDLRITRTNFTHNISPSGAFGALWLTGGTASIDESTVGHNFSDTGPAGITVGAAATLTISNSALVSNESLSTGSALVNSGTVEAVNTTFADNQGGDHTGPSDRSGTTIRNMGRLTLTNSTLRNPRFFPSSNIESVLGSFAGATTIVRNTLFSEDPDDPNLRDCDGVVESDGNNLFDDVTGCTVALQPTDVIADAKVDVAVTDDGKPGHQFLALLPTSPAINAANDTVCSLKDQIGDARRGACDIGAVEFRKRLAPSDQDRLAVDLSASQQE